MSKSLRLSAARISVSPERVSPCASRARMTGRMTLFGQRQSGDGDDVAAGKVSFDHHRPMMLKSCLAARPSNSGAAARHRVRRRGSDGFCGEARHRAHDVQRYSSEVSLRSRCAPTDHRCTDRRSRVKRRAFHFDDMVHGAGKYAKTPAWPYGENRIGGCRRRDRRDLDEAPPPGAIWRSSWA